MENSKLTRIEQVYIRYLQDVGQIKYLQTFTDGLMGFGRKNDSFTCHDEFIQELEAAITELVKRSESQDTIYKAIEFIYEQPLLHRDSQSAFWMMIAAHSLTEVMIPLISTDMSKELASSYSSMYPRRERLPVQKKILKLLENHE